MLKLLNEFFFWFPWMDLFSEKLFLQLFLTISLFFFLLSSNNFYSLVFFFINTLLFGLFLSFFNLEFLTGFLWVAELTILFIFILFFFFINSSNNFIKKKWFFSLLIVSGFTMSVLTSFIFIAPAHCLLNISSFWDDYYQAIYFNVVNDIHGFFLSYYIFNSFFFIFLGFLLLLVSIICIQLLRRVHAQQVASVSSKTFSSFFFEHLCTFNFLRHQNLFYQNLRKSVNNIYLRRPKEWSKKEPKQ